MEKRITRSQTAPVKRATPNPIVKVKITKMEVAKKMAALKRRAKKVAARPIRSAQKVKSAPKATKAKKISKVPPKQVMRMPPALKKTTKATAGPKGYTAAEYRQFTNFRMQFAAKGNQTLKDLLRKNQQSMTGDKAELIEKCADGATLGAIPRCPNCFGGKPKFDCKTSRYHCSGYRDDTEFTFCRSTFTKSDLKRNTWDN